LYAAAPSHKLPSQFLIANKTQTNIASPQISALMTFFASIMERENGSMILTAKASKRSL
jgi:hypothetical protein